MDLLSMKRMHMEAKRAKVTGRSRLPGAQKPAACRSLFGRPDDMPASEQETRRTLREIEAVTLERLSDKYNFDFRTDRPREGRFLWKKVGGQDDENGGHPDDHRVGRFDGDDEGEASPPSGSNASQVSCLRLINETPESASSSDDSKTSSVTSDVTSDGRTTVTSSMTLKGLEVTPVTAGVKRRHSRLTDHYAVCKKPKTLK